MSNIGDSKNGTGCWWVYVARCNDGTLYTGITTDLTRRERQHNGALHGGAKYTSARRPVRIIAACTSDTRSTALRLELNIKKKPRKEKLVWCEEHKWERDEKNH